MAKQKTKPNQKEGPDPLRPDMGLLIKLGSIAVHADEFTSLGGHEVDQLALRQGLDDPDVKAWLAKMTEMALVPVKRTG